MRSFVGTWLMWRMAERGMIGDMIKDFMINMSDDSKDEDNDKTDLLDDDD